MEKEQVEVSRKKEISIEIGECSKNLDKNEKVDDFDLTNIDEYFEKKQITLLNYEREMFLDIIHSDGLVVCAKGISYDRVLTNFLKIYSDAGNLILIINSSDWEEKFYKSQLEKKYVHEVANTATERERVYLEGGIQFISTRILVVDLLKKRIPIELITGIIVLRAHQIVESCQEAFAIRLYRQTNKTGFIKGFSMSSEAFTIGFSHIERTMRNLFVKELFIWPRFHSSIQSSLKPYEAQTIELHIPMTQKMLQIQTHILDIMNYLVKELKRINRTADLQEITVENCITKNFHKILQAQLDCIWHQLNSQTKLIVTDLKVLRNLMISTIYSDSISAYALMKRYRTKEYALTNSGWVLLDAAEQMFKLSKERVFNKEQEFEPEFCPKWKALSEIFRVEIPNSHKTNKPAKVLVLCQDSRTCYQLNQFLTQGGERYLLNTATRNDVSIKNLSENYKEINNKGFFQYEKQKTLEIFKKPSIKNLNENKSNESNENLEDENELMNVLTKDDFIENNDNFRESYILTMSQQCNNETQLLLDENKFDVTIMENADFEEFPELENLDMTCIIETTNQPIICIQTFKTEKDGSMALDHILNDIDPQYVIMYHSNVAAIRQLEVYEARKIRSSKDRMKVFFLIHARTVEEQSFLTSLRREKQAFELLIDTKSKMIIPEYQDGKSDEAFVLVKNHLDLDDNNASTRKAGGQQQQSETIIIPKIIVDMREFRSDLPCLLHKRGIEVIPVTITIGDYILTPDICVERKSISDLIGSLNSGRLYNQCIQMQRYYQKPILLIEFDQNKPFHLQGKYMYSGDSVSSNSDIVQKLQLLTLHFPKLRLIWSPSPYATAQLFEEMKQGKPEPDSQIAASIGSDDCILYNDNFNTNIYDFLIRLPGINSLNIRTIMKNGGSLKELLKKSEDELSQLLDSKINGKLLWNILNIAHQPMASEESGKIGLNSLRFKRGRGRGKRF